MNTIIPAIIPQSLEHIKDSIFSLEGVAKEFQIDIVDGSFVPFTSWPYRGSGSVMLLRDFAQHNILEVDLMIESPERALPLYVDAGVKKVVIHLESVTDLPSIYAHRNEKRYELGLSIRNDTNLEVLEAELEHADYVQLMGIRKIGSQGQPFDEEVLRRIERLRGLHPNIIISIDGSVNEETLPRLRNAGANRFVSGSAIYSSADTKRAFEALSNL